jgi:D-serine deaminase-like pyridoxal phosphate-dependent protein
VRFRNSLFVLSTVMSVAGGRLILDAGLKAYSVDSGLPQAPDAPGWQFARATDEHGILTPASSAPPLPIDIGTKLKLIPGHCDPTVNLHDWYVAVRGGVVEAVWPIAARGAIS